MSMNNNLFDQAFVCLNTASPTEKASRTQWLQEQWAKGALCQTSTEPPQRLPVPGRPLLPKLVHPREVPKRGFNSHIGRLRLVHAIAHIEFNAINLALDAVYHFRDMPDQYYSDWLRVAVEEARHFSLLNGYLESGGVHYGEYTAHNGLWEMALKTDHDVLVRMALVPRVLEARGLDVTRGMIDKLESAGETELVQILEVIYRDEIGHVKIGTHWFNYLCQQQGRNAEETFSQLLDEYMGDAVFGPFDEKARTQAGFTAEEMKDLVRRANT